MQRESAFQEAVGSGIDDVIAKYRKVNPAPLSPAATSPARSVQSVAIQVRGFESINSSAVVSVSTYFD